MDDLILWITYTKEDVNSYNEALSIKNTILTDNKVYTGGLSSKNKNTHTYLTSTQFISLLVLSYTAITSTKYFLLFILLTEILKVFVRIIKDILDT